MNEKGIKLVGSAAYLLDVNIDCCRVDSLGGKERLGTPVLRHQFQPVAGGVFVVQRPGQAQVSGAGIDGKRTDGDGCAAATDAVVDLAVDALVGVLSEHPSDRGMQRLVLVDSEPENWKRRDKISAR